MSKISEIKKNLKYGDQRTIAKTVNCSPELVKKVLRGERNCIKGKGKRVIEVAQLIIENRQLLLNEHKT
jgi:hypothetical protein